MGSSAQNSSGVHWCRRRVRLNEVPEKVAKVPEKVLGQSQVRFNSGEGSAEGSGQGLGAFGAEPGEGSRKAWCKVKSGSIGFRRRLQRRFRFNRVSEKVPGKVPEKVWEALGQVQKGPGEGLGGFGAALVQSQARLNRVPQKVLEKVPGSLGAKPGGCWGGAGGGIGLGGVGCGTPGGTVFIYPPFNRGIFGGVRQEIFEKYFT